MQFSDLSCSDNLHYQNQVGRGVGWIDPLLDKSVVEYHLFRPDSGVGYHLSMDIPDIESRRKIEIDEELR